MQKIYADIIIDISHEAIDRAFQYEVPDFWREKIEIGMEVSIPFGRGNTIRKGYVVDFHDTPNYDKDKIKQIVAVNDDEPAIESELIGLAAYIKEAYGSTMIQALKTVMPVKQKIKRMVKRFVQLNITKEEARQNLFIYQKKNAKAKCRLISELIDTKELSFHLVMDKLNVSSSTLKALEAEGVIRILSQEMYRNPVEVRSLKASVLLNEKQKELIAEFKEDYEQGRFPTYLLHGVTGSGKTEIYIECIEHVVKMGKQAIMLIPEIALTYQTVKRFQNRFGDRVTIMNSKLSKGERYDQFLRMKEGKIDIVVGPRSALFVPFSDLGLVIIDEEHESSYKSDYPPKYHAREVGIHRAYQVGASVILGSATPSVESYYQAKEGKYRLWELAERGVPDAVLPDVEIIDLKQELKQGNRSMFSYRLQELIADRLSKGEQIMLFINRRGFAGFMSCRSCGHVMKCSHCDVSLTLHNNGKLICHYCGYEENKPTTCPSCSSKFIAGFGVGTQKIEDGIGALFPKAKILRMDMDTTKKKHSHEEILSKFANQEADILVGTQMIVKGHDFSNVTLVGIIAADTTLFDNDYRSAERTFDLLTQAAGRAGRGNLRGDVIIQTYAPEHYCIEAAAAQDYHAFYEKEIAFRSLLKYPPIYHMLVVFITAEEYEIAKNVSVQIGNYVKEQLSEEKKKISVIGPTDATFGKLNDLYRRVLYIKHEEYQVLIQMKNQIEGFLEQEESLKKAVVVFDFNPMSGY